MTEQSAAWSDVGTKLTALGQKLRTHFVERRDETAGGDAAAPGAEQPGAAAQDAPGADEALQGALRKLGAAIDDVIDAVGASIKDPAVKADVREVGSSLSTAISTSFEELSTDLRNAFGRGKQPPSEPSAPPEPHDPPEGPPAG